MKLVFDTESVSSESDSEASEEMTRDEGVATEVASGVTERGNGESRLRVAVCSMFNDNDDGVTTSTFCSVDAISGDGVEDNSGDVDGLVLRGSCCSVGIKGTEEEGDTLDNGRAT